MPSDAFIHLATLNNAVLAPVSTFLNKPKRWYIFLPFFPMALMLLYLGDAFSPNFSARVGLMDIDLTTNMAATASGSMAKQLIWPLLVLFTFLIALKRKVNLGAVLWAGRWFWFMAAVMIASAAWSNHPSLTFKRGVLQLLIFAAIMLMVFSAGNAGAVEKVVYKVGCLLLVAQVAFIALFPRYAFDNFGAFAGLAGNKNLAGFTAALFFGASYLYPGPAKLRRSGQVRLAKIAAGCWMALLLLSQSKTSIAIVLLFLILFTFFGRKAMTVITIWLLIGVKSLLLLTPMMMAFAGVDGISLASDLFHTLELTGRDQIWSRMLDRIALNPWFGEGYAAYWGTGEVPDEMDVRFSFLQYINQAHNGYLDVLIPFGFIGLAIFLTGLLQALSRNWRTVSAFQSFVVFFAVIHNFTESSWMRDEHLVWIFVIMVLAMRTLPLQSKIERVDQ